MSGFAGFTQMAQLASPRERERRAGRPAGPRRTATRHFGQRSTSSVLCAGQTTAQPRFHQAGTLRPKPQGTWDMLGCRRTAPTHGPLPGALTPCHPHGRLPDPGPSRRRPPGCIPRTTSELTPVAASIALRVSGIVTTPYASERTSLDVRTSSPNASTIVHDGHPFRRAIRSTHDANDSPNAGATTNASRRGLSVTISRVGPPVEHASLPVL